MQDTEDIDQGDGGDDDDDDQPDAATTPAAEASISSGGQRQPNRATAKPKPKAMTARKALTGSQRKALQGLRLLGKNTT